MNTPLFSILIPTHNRGDFLKIAIGSILAQTFTDFELIIIDDGSTDHTREIVESLIKPPKTYDARRTTLDDFPVIRYFYQENHGPAVARNRGIEQARGDYIVFLDSDDRFRANKLDVSARFIRNHRGYKIFHSEEIWYRNGMLLAHKKHHHKPDGYVFEKALALCCISLSTACIHRDVFDGIGIFDETLPVCEDYDFWLRVTAAYPVKLIRQPLTIKEGGYPDQQSKRYPALDVYRMYAIEKLIKSGTLDEEKLKMAIEEYTRKCHIYLKGAAKRGRHDEIRMYEEKLNTLKTYVKSEIRISKS
ncbi:MAG: glycosyltransferase family 2 protein [Candidatus Omnitrophica bacterium]|nr:glycosyltransferase family 2 protein [Candidatus Omnitrophota bacterium]